MSKIEIKKTIDELRKKIEKYNKLYYDENISEISDSEYDSLMQDLIELEKKYPVFISSDSPTQKVSGLVNKKFSKYNHSVSMLSLANAFNVDDLYNFDKRVKKILNKKNIQYFCEYKIDGLSVSLIYENQKLITAATRGDGKVGENITSNIMQIASIPKKILYKDNLIVRGEVFFTKEQFNVINIERKNKNEILFANSRNAASGTLRQLDSSIVKKRNLSIFSYFVKKNEKSITHKDDIDFLEENNFPINKEYNKLFNSIDETIEYIKILEEKRNNLNYNVDGIVIKVNDITYQNILGSTTKFPRWAIAYKFEAVRASTILEDIFPTVGRTGKITFNAKLKPVELVGTIVKSATLHNADYILKNDIRIGDYVLVKKAGDIIPKVIKPIIEKRKDDVIKWTPVLFCPDCESELTKKDKNVDLYCLNKNCYKKYLRTIEHFVSKKAMNIQGISNKLLDKFCQLKLINSFSDLFLLKDHKEEIIKIDKMGEKLFDNIINSIEKSKNVSLDKFIFALGINNVGSYTAMILANKFKDIKKIMHLKIKHLDQIDNIGPTISESIIEYFKDKNNIKEIKRLLSLGITPYVNEQEKRLLNITFAFTGSLEKSRDDYKNLIENLGGKVSSTVSSKTNYLVLGQKPGSKYNKAKAIESIKIINENDLNNILKG